jgi:glycosyltransferase involved in cell wall biosynthesis
MLLILSFLILLISNNNSIKKDIISNINIKYVKKLTSFFGLSREVKILLNKEDPDVIIRIIGISNFLKLNPYNKIPSIGVLTSPIYSLIEILRLDIKEIILNYNYIYIHLFGSIIPNFFLFRFLNTFKKIVVLSKSNEKKLLSYGISKNKITFIPSGIHESDLLLLDEKEINDYKNQINPKKVPVILYFGSPLTLRGTDTLIKAFAKVNNKIESKLIFLSRIENNELLIQENILKELAKKLGIINSTEIVSGILKPDEIKKYLSIADIICLPFKIVISDNPISILEGLSLGKPTISTNIDGIPEMLDERDLIVNPNNSNELANSIIYLLSNKNLLEKIGEDARKHMLQYPKWENVGEKFLTIIEELNCEHSY